MATRTSRAEAAKSEAEDRAFRMARQAAWVFLRPDFADVSPDSSEDATEERFGPIPNSRAESAAAAIIDLEVLQHLVAEDYSRIAATSLPDQIRNLTGDHETALYTQIEHTLETLHGMLPNQNPAA